MSQMLGTYGLCRKQPPPSTCMWPAHLRSVLCRVHTCTIAVAHLSKVGMQLLLEITSFKSKLNKGICGFLLLLPLQGSPGGWGRGFVLTWASAELDLKGERLVPAKMHQATGPGQRLSFGKTQCKGVPYFVGTQ